MDDTRSAVIICDMPIPGDCFGNERPEIILDISLPKTGDNLLRFSMEECQGQRVQVQRFKTGI